MHILFGRVCEFKEVFLVLLCFSVAVPPSWKIVSIVLSPVPLVLHGLVYAIFFHPGTASLEMGNSGIMEGGRQLLSSFQWRGKQRELSRSFGVADLRQESFF